jgi:hypothetical protein
MAKKSIPVDGGNGNGLELAKKERELLGKVVLKRFTATPQTVPTFGSVTLAWEVTLPENPVFDITVTLNKAAVPPQGSASRSLFQPTFFTLAAVTEHAGRNLRTLDVAVDHAGCQTRVLEASIITSILKNEFDSRFTGSDRFSLKGNGTDVTLGNGVIIINVPLTINVPDWFDADMSIDLQLAMAPGTPLSVVVTQTNVSVSWSFFENLLSLGCGNLVESGMEQMAQAFMRNIAEAEIAPRIQTQFIDQVNGFLSSLKDADPAHREFLPTALILSPTGFSIMGCPKA